MKSIKTLALVAIFASLCSFKSDKQTLDVTGWTPTYVSDEIFLKAFFSPASDGYYHVIFEVDWRDSHGNPAQNSIEIDVTPGDTWDVGSTVDSRIVGGSNFTYTIIGIF